MTKKHRRIAILERPWGFAIAMLTASIVTLVGACLQFDPDVILWRASLSAVVAGVVTRCLLESAQILLTA